MSKWRTLIAEVRYRSRVVSTVLRRALRRSDYGRWGDAGSLDEEWDSRTVQMAQLVSPGSSVIEFGAGRMVLKDHLPADCSYTPSDLVSRGPGTLVCDLNGALPDLDSYDFAVFSGVLEYVNEVPRLIAHLAPRVRSIIASYATTDLNPVHRRVHGWVNDYAEKDFLDVFESHGYELNHRSLWRSQVVFRFRQATHDGFDHATTH